MNYKRWYDQQTDLRIIVESLRELNQSARRTFAEEIVQSTLNKQFDKDTFLEIIGKNVIASGNRWYDRDDTFKTAIEMLKYLSIEEIEELYRDTIIYMVYEDENFPRN